MKKIVNVLFGRIFPLIIGFIIQLVLLIFAVAIFSDYFVYFYLFSAIITGLTLLFIIDNKSNPSYKIAWILCVMCIPIFGWLFYYLFGDNKFAKLNRNFLEHKFKKISEQTIQDKAVYKEILNSSRTIANHLNYFNNYAGYNAYKNSQTKYYPLGEYMLKDMLVELKKAEKFIFLEYFIIEEGKMWNQILDILKKKAESGVDVRVIYDDLGSLFTLPKDYPSKLENLGIKCCVFNPMSSFFSVRYNNRNHCKIMVIDGKTAFTGGVNLADEYINEKVRFGHWKDTGVMLKGEAVYSFTIMFLSLWESTKNSQEDYSAYKTDYPKEIYNDGYVVPFMDNPLNEEIVSETVYMNLIQSAENYVYINTPYLIIDNEMATCLCNAAKRGIDVRILTPHIPDKRIVWSVTRANYIPLVEAGVKVYEYTPGFVHAKSIVVDDILSVVGTINLDYRSLYLHFENGLWMYKSKAISDIKEDYINTLKKSKEITKEDIKKISKHKRIYRSVLKIFAPFM